MPGSPCLFLPGSCLSRRTWRPGFPGKPGQANCFAKAATGGPYAAFGRNAATGAACWQRLAWLQEAELVRAKAEHVQILTLHASKGLEFKAVFLPGLESGLLPLRRELLFEAHAGLPADSELEKKAEAALAEERRLLYVGLTRAEQALFVSYSQSRTLYGKKLRLAPSPFLAQIREFCRQSTLMSHKRKSEEHLSLL